MLAERLLDAGVEAAGRSHFRAAGEGALDRAAGQTCLGERAQLGGGHRADRRSGDAERQRLGGVALVVLALIHRPAVHAADRQRIARRACADGAGGPLLTGLGRSLAGQTSAAAEPLRHLRAELRQLGPGQSLVGHASGRRAGERHARQRRDGLGDVVADACGRPGMILVLLVADLLRALHRVLAVSRAIIGEAVQAGDAADRGKRRAKVSPRAICAGLQAGNEPAGVLRGRGRKGNRSPIRKRIVVSHKKPSD